MTLVLMMLQKSSSGRMLKGCSIWTPMFSTPISRKATTACRGAQGRGQCQGVRSCVAHAQAEGVWSRNGFRREHL